MHIIVVGAGIVGLSAVRAALVAGHRVTLLEQGEIPNPRSASYDQHRLIRYQYGSAEGYTRMVKAGFEAWDRLWADLGTSYFVRSGALAVAIDDDPYVRRSLSTITRLGIGFQKLSATEVERVCPQLTVPETAWGLLNEDGGALLADQIVDALIHFAKERGADLRAGCAVEAIDDDHAAVKLADGAEVSGDAIVVATGAGLPELMPKYRGLATYRQAVCYVDAPDNHIEHWRRGPCVTDLGPGDNYALTPVGGTELKFGTGIHRRRGAPEDGFEASMEEGQAIIAPFLPFLKDAERYKPARLWVGYYVKDGTGQFKIDRMNKALVVTNCDGQMFKFGSLMGEKIIACLDGDLSADALARWATGN